jgi:broad specificity phosphatase PhoE
MRGDELLELLRREGAAGRPLAAMMRHAARHPIADPKQPHLAELTAEGCAAAEEFGARLAGFGRVRLFHSPVKRCLQTAECVAHGAARAGVRAEICGAHAELGIDYIRDVGEAGRLSVIHGEHFVRLWFEGRVPPQVIDPAPALAARKVAFVERRLAEVAGEPGTLDLHVSHDWNIIILREHLVGVRHEEAGWLTFLDGVAFTPSSGGLRASYRDRQREIPAS